MSRKLKTTKESDVKVLSRPSIMESGVYDVVFSVNGEVVEREFEVVVKIKYGEPCFCGCGHREAREVYVWAKCCNEEDEDVADIMEYKLEEEVEWYIWSR